MIKRFSGIFNRGPFPLLPILINELVVHTFNHKVLHARRSDLPPVIHQKYPSGNRDSNTLSFFHEGIKVAIRTTDHMANMTGLAIQLSPMNGMRIGWLDRGMAFLTLCIHGPRLLQRYVFDSIAVHLP